MGKSPSMEVRTRFAPSPTGFLHVGGARTALFSWAYARRHGGQFILRIEDTDLERSTEQSVQAILEGMRWLGLDWDEGPFFQMQRLARYKEVAEQLIAAGHAYYDYMPRQELDALRAQQTARGEKPRYDRAVGQRYRGTGPAPVRFRTPQEGEVGWDDLVKGPIAFPNAELDDLVLLRADGVPTYNFGVVVDDLARLAALVEPELRKRGAQPGGGPPLERVLALLKDRAASIVQLADEAMLFYQVEVSVAPEWGANAGEEVLKALRMLKARLV